MRTLSTFVLALPIALAAQHCAFDFRSVIVVRPHAAGDSTVIDGLRLTLLDSNNVPVIHYDNPWYLFRRNHWVPLCGYARYKGPYHHYFPFAADNYVLEVPNNFRTEKMKVLVQDERDDGPLNRRRDRWPVRFKQQVVALTAHDSYPLCGLFDEHAYPPLEGRPNFAPVDITLRTR